MEQIDELRRRVHALRAVIKDADEMRRRVHALQVPDEEPIDLAELVAAKDELERRIAVLEAGTPEAQLFGDDLISSIEDMVEHARLQGWRLLNLMGLHKGQYQCNFIAAESGFATEYAIGDTPAEAVALASLKLYPLEGELAPLWVAKMEDAFNQLTATLRAFSPIKGG